MFGTSAESLCETLEHARLDVVVDHVTYDLCDCRYELKHCGAQQKVRHWFNFVSPVARLPFHPFLSVVERPILSSICRVGFATYSTILKS